MRHFYFWQKFLFISNLIFASWGLLTTIAPNGEIFRWYYGALSKVLFFQETLPPDVIIFRNFISGPLGGTITAFYVLAAYVSAVPFKNKERWSRNVLVAAYGCWAFIDCLVCLSHGVYFQIYVLNAFSIALKVLPIWFTWRDFSSSKETERRVNFL